MGLSCWHHASGSPGLRSRPPLARRAVRRPILHRRHQHRHLLPADLPGACAEGREYQVLPDGRRRGGRGIPPLSALSARSFSRDTRLARHIGGRVPGASAHRRGRSGRRGSRTAGGPPRSHRPASAKALPTAPRRGAARGRANAPRSLCEEAPRRDLSWLRRGRVRLRFWKRPSVQQPDSPHLLLADRRVLLSTNRKTRCSYPRRVGRDSRSSRLHAGDLRVSRSSPGASEAGRRGIRPELRTSDARAPRAIRIPISRVRARTE